MVLHLRSTTQIKVDAFCFTIDCVAGDETPAAPVIPSPPELTPYAA